MVTNAKHKALSNIDYGFNYNEIFENNNPELDRQISLINKFNIQLNSKLSNKIDYKNKINKLFQHNDFFNQISSN